MKVFCPSCASLSQFRPNSVRRGKYYRKSDRRWIQRFKCLGCGRGYSTATQNECFGQKKRQLNFSIRLLLVSGVSMRRIAKLLSINRKTVALKLVYLGVKAANQNAAFLSTLSQLTNLQFDDLETIEHTKCKPLSVSLAVEPEHRKILGFRVAQMPAKGHLAKLARKKYGKRTDHRSQARRSLFLELKEHLHPQIEVLSDENPHYWPSIREILPQACHRTVKGRRGCVAGQGELKKIGFDPLFSLNHTCAMLRANINRLFRRTWCTTKKVDALIHHVNIYVEYHNSKLTA